MLPSTGSTGLHALALVEVHPHPLPLMWMGTWLTIPMWMSWTLPSLTGTSWPDLLKLEGFVLAMADQPPSQAFSSTCMLRTLAHQCLQWEDRFLTSLLSVWIQKSLLVSQSSSWILFSKLPLAMLLILSSRPPHNMLLLPLNSPQLLLIALLPLQLLWCIRMEFLSKYQSSATTTTEKIRNRGSPKL